MLLVSFIIVIILLQNINKLLLLVYSKNKDDLK